MVWFEPDERATEQDLLLNPRHFGDAQNARIPYQIGLRVAGRSA